MTLRVFAAGLLVAASAAAAPAAEIKIIAPDLPPMIDQSGKGREAEVIARTLAACGHTASFKIEPYGRHFEQYRKDEKADAVTTVSMGLELPGYPSVTYIHYQNGASVLKDSGLQVAALDDLKGKRAVTFPAGKDILPGLKAFAPSLAELQEKSDQLSHSKMLFAKRVDVVLGDGLIFAEYNRQLRSKAAALSFDPSQGVVFTAIFPPTPYVMMFRNEAIRNDFDRCYADLSKRGEIDMINKAAVEPYRETVGKNYLND